MSIGGEILYENDIGLKIAFKKRKLLNRMTVEYKGDYKLLNIEGISLYLPNSKSNEEIVNIYCECMLPYHPHYYLRNPVKKNDIVFDCGGCEGLFAKSIIEYVERVYIFEPSSKMCRCLEKTFEKEINSGKVVVIEAALGKENGIIKYVEDDSAISDGYVTDDHCENGVWVKNITIDSAMNEYNIPRVDYIKSDIEGAERNMLLGARNTIGKYRPRLSLCCYHYADDEEVLRNTICTIRDDYKEIVFGKVQFAEKIGSVMMYYF